MLRWRQWLAGRHWPELGEDRAQRADARRERVAVVFDDLLKLLAEVFASEGIEAKVFCGVCALLSVSLYPCNLINFASI
jgi:hypothetical protein